MKKSLQSLLKDGDPILQEPTLAPDEIEWMRHLVIAAEGKKPASNWTMRIAYASAFAAVIGVSGWLNYETTSRNAAMVADSRSPGPSGPGLAGVARGERRQLQFATPGGTRVIWVFDSNFEMR
jgi:hypothetical protein